MNRGWSIGAVCLAAACSHDAPANSAQSPGATNAAQAPSATVVDDPQSCVEPPSTTRPPEPSGRLQPEEIQRIVRERYGAFQSCYVAGLGRNPKLRGKVAVGFLIGPEGTVTSARIMSNELPDCPVAACVRDEMTKCVFPKPTPEGTVAVVYPIIFEPG